MYCSLLIPNYKLVHFGELKGHKASLAYISFYDNENKHTFE